MEFLEVMSSTMIVTEAKDWLTDIWSIPSSILEILLVNKWSCFSCQYSGIQRSFIRKHCSMKHKGKNIFS